jgi:serine/threonine-protein kinase
MYRLSFDFFVGAVAFAVMVLGQWGIVIAETLGVLRPQPLRLEGPPDQIYLVFGRELAAMVMLTGMYVVTFLFANWAVARMRHKELAIRLLRESLYASRAGRVGRHTGRTLRDTYVVGALIGTGGMGEVYTGHHRRTQRQVAIKLLHPHLLEDPKLRKRFRREAEIAGRLGSQHIVEIIDVDVDADDDGQPFLVLELLEGESLTARVDRAGSLSFAAASSLMDQLAQGLAVAHARGVVHRDLKPDNVFLCPDRDGERVKILDFGVSKITGTATALTQEVAILGTPDFMSPEQAIGLTEEVDLKSDIFALGGIAYFALTGTRPFHASSVPALLRRICDEEPVPIERLRRDVPAGVAEVLALAMAKRPAQRTGTALAVASDLRAAIAGQLAPDVAVRAGRIARGRPASHSIVGDHTASPSAPTLRPSAES